MPLPVSPAVQLPHTANAAPAPESQTIVRGSLRLDLRGYAVAVDGRDIELTITEFLLLHALAQQPYRVLDRAILAHAVYAHGHGQAARPMSPRAVDLHISRLRRKLSRSGCDAIKTMRFVGYRFVPPIAA